MCVCGLKQKEIGEHVSLRATGVLVRGLARLIGTQRLKQRAMQREEGRVRDGESNTELLRRRDEKSDRDRLRCLCTEHRIQETRWCRKIGGRGLATAWRRV